MAVDAFQQIDDLVPLKARALNVVEEAFKVVDGLQKGWNEGERNGEAKAPFDIKGQQPLGNTKFDIRDPKRNFDPMTLDHVMKEIYACSKCIKLVTTIFLMNLCTIYKISNKFAYEFFAFLQHQLFLEPNCLISNYYVARVLT
jgi:hypothetical protein